MGIRNCVHDKLEVLGDAFEENSFRISKTETNECYFCGLYFREDVLVITESHLVLQCDEFQ